MSMSNTLGKLIAEVRAEKGNKVNKKTNRRIYPLYIEVAVVILMFSTYLTVCFLPLWVVSLFFFEPERFVAYPVVSFLVAYTSLVVLLIFVSSERKKKGE